MDERDLLILGLLTAQSQHGYQINDFIERNLGRVYDMKKATAYSVLKRLNKGGFVEVKVEQDGNRPPRQVYSITPLGEEKFANELRQSLSHVENVTPAGMISYMFLDHLPKTEVMNCLETRLEKLDELLKIYENTPAHGHGIGVDLATEHRLTLVRCDREWLAGVIRRIGEEPTDGPYFQRSPAGMMHPRVSHHKEKQE